MRTMRIRARAMGVAASAVLATATLGLSSASATQPPVGGSGYPACKSSTTSYRSTSGGGLAFQWRTYVEWKNTSTEHHLYVAAVFRHWHTTNGHTYHRLAEAAYMQIGSASAKKTSGAFTTVNWAPTYRPRKQGTYGMEPRAGFRKPSEYYHKRVRIALNLGGHKFYGPWRTIGKGTDC